MKLIVPTFLLGTALGASAVWFALRTEETPVPKKTVATATAEQAEFTRLRSLVAAQKEEITALREQALAAASTPPPAPPHEPKKEEGMGDMMAKMIGSGMVSKMMETQAKKERTSKVERLSAKLKLTPEQRSSLDAFLEAQDKAKIAQMEKMQKSPLMKKMFSGQELTEAEQKEMDAMEKESDPQKKTSLTEWTKENLTLEQTTEYARYQQERKASEAESSATRQLNSISAVVDLTDEQKDKIFKNYADKAMKSSAAEETFGGPSLPEGAHSGLTVEAVVDAKGDATTDGLETILTPEQLQTYRTHQEAELKAQLETMKAMGMPPSVIKKMEAQSKKK